MASPGFAIPQLPTGPPPDQNDPNYQNQLKYGVYGAGGWNDPYGPGAGQSTPMAPPASNGFNVNGPTADVNPNAPMEDIFAANRNTTATTGDVLGSEEASQLNYYSPIQQQMQSAQDASLNQLAQTPGYTPDQSAQINTDYSQFNTGQGGFDAMKGDPNAPVSTLQHNQETGTGAMLNQYQSNLGGQVGNLNTGLNTALSGYKSGLTGAAATAGADTRATMYSGVAPNVRGEVTGLGAGLQGAQGKFSGLDTAVNDPSLGFDPNSTEKQLTDQDVQEMRTSAGTSVGNQFRTAEDTLERQAAAQGNTSPAALAAMRQQLVTQEGATAGDEEVKAEIAAKQAQYQRAAGIEQQRSGEAQVRQGMRATASTTEEAAAQAAAGQYGQAGIASEEQLGQEALGVETLAGQQDIAAQNTLGQAGLNTAATEGQAGIGAAENYGQFSTDTSNRMAEDTLGAQQTADAATAARAAAVNNMAYQQGTGSAALTAQGAEAVGNAQIAGQNAYRSDVAQQQGMAQQGGQQAVQQQNQTYSTQTTGQNQNAQGQAGFEVGKASAGDTLVKAGSQALANLFEEGGVATEPTLAKVGEHGPEMIVPLGRYRSRMRRDEDGFGVAA